MQQLLGIHWHSLESYQDMKIRSSFFESFSQLGHDNLNWNMWNTYFGIESKRTTFMRYNFHKVSIFIKRKRNSSGNYNKFVVHRSCNSCTLCMVYVGTNVGQHVVYETKPNSHEFTHSQAMQSMKKSTNTTYHVCKYWLYFKTIILEYFASYCRLYLLWEKSERQAEKNEDGKKKERLKERGVSEGREQTWT